MKSTEGEKSMAMLNRWVSMKRMLNAKTRDKRPDTPGEATRIQECQAWRVGVLRDLVKKVNDV